MGYDVHRYKHKKPEKGKEYPYFRVTIDELTVDVPNVTLMTLKQLEMAK